jgi:preprotein translocase subunit SecD
MLCFGAGGGQMRGLRWCVVVLVMLALLLNDSPTSDGRSAIQPQLSTTQTLRSWDGRGLPIPDRTISVAEMQAELEKFGGSRIVIKVDEAGLLKNLLTTVQDDVRHLLRAARIGFIGLTVRDGSVEVRIRKDEELARALAAFGATPAQPDKALGGAVNMRVDSDSLVRLTPTVAELDDLLRATVEQSMRTLTRPIAMHDAYEFGARQLGPNRIELLLPGLMDVSRLPRVIYQASQVSFRLIEGIGAMQAPGDNRIASMKVLRASENAVPYLVQKKALLDGRDVRYATAILDPYTLKPMVAFQLSAQATGRFAKATQENVGRSVVVELDGRSVAIGWHDRVAATPAIREPIKDGRGRIEGKFTIDEARHLALHLRAGILDVPWILVEEEQVVAAEKP